MVDIDPEVFDGLYNILTAEFPGITVEGRMIHRPEIFPTVVIYQFDNTVYRSSQDSTHTENHAVIIYDIRVYTNAPSGAMMQAKAIAAVCDEYMGNIGFTRRWQRPAEDPYNTQFSENFPVYMVIGRYEAVVGKNKVIYRR